LQQQLLANGDPGQEAAIELGIGQQGKQGGREAEGEPGALAPVSGGGLQHGKKWQVALLERLEIPIFFQRTGFAGAYVGKMGVED
jgi:hypothetical protein